MHPFVRFFECEIVWLVSISLVVIMSLHVLETFTKNKKKETSWTG